MLHKSNNFHKECAFLFMVKMHTPFSAFSYESSEDLCSNNWRCVFRASLIGAHFLFCYNNCAYFVDIMKMEEQLMEKNDDIKETKFCKECGEKIDRKAVFCTHCGCMVENIQVQQPQIVINNSNQNQNVNIPVTRAPKKINKWVAFFLCLFLL